MSQENKPVLGMILGVTGIASFSLTLPMTRIAVAGMEAGTVAVWRGLIAAALAALILLAFYRGWPARRHIVPLLLAGIGIVIGFPVLTTLAMQTIPASHGAIITALLPITTVAVSVLATSERPSRSFWIVSVFGTIVILVFIVRQSDGGLRIGHLYLIAAVLLAAVGYAFGAKAAKDIGGLRVICWALVLMAPALIVAAFFVAPVPWDAPTDSVLAFLYLSLISQLAGFIAWYGGMAMAGIARVSQVQLLQLFMTLIASAVLLAEPLSAEIWLFAALVMACVVIGTRLRVD